MAAGKGVASIGAATFAALVVAVIALSAVTLTADDLAGGTTTTVSVPVHTGPPANLYSEGVPRPEQGEGGPDIVPTEAWWVPAGECTDVRALLLEHDLIGPTADRLLWIARAESDCGTQRVNDTSQDYGVWQINWPTWGGPLCRNAGICTTPYELAHDDDVQAEAVAVILEWQGWTAWCWSTPDHHARGIGYACPWGIAEHG